jgi:hypothetical protein
MKNVTINTAAAWAASFRSFQDGDIFRESNIDLNAGDLADRLGYLKATVDNAMLLTGNQTAAGNKTFSGATTMSGGLDITGGDLNFSGAGSVTIDRPIEINEALTQNGFAQLLAQVQFGMDFPADSNATFAAGKTMHRLPALTGNRVYTLPSGTSGQIKIITRGATTGAFTATINDGSRTLAVIPASTQGWIVVVCQGGTVWNNVLWSSALTSVLSEV